jgi:predicted transcriptional regulator
LNQFIHSTSQLKKMNIELVKKVLKAQGIGTKAVIAKMTNLSVATCGNILNELVEIGEVIELEPEESNGGRPALKYKYNANFGYIINMIVSTEGGKQSLSYNVLNLIGD